MKTANDEQCFEEAPQHQQLIEQVRITKTQLLGDANPIYVKKNNDEGIDYQNVSLKVIPILNINQIRSYIPFRLNAKKNKQVATTANVKKKFVEEEEAQQTIVVNKPKSSSNLMNVFNSYYERNEMVYCKFNNSVCNLYKDTIYFAGAFVPRDILSHKFKNMLINSKQPNLVYSIGSILQTKNKTSMLKSELALKKIRNKQNLQFDSNFQSGNLYAAFKISKYAYDLVLQNDINSRGSTQWFYFSIQGMEANVDYHFRIVNFTKNDSLFNYGMKPVIYSLAENAGTTPNDLAEQKQEKVGWYRYGKDVTYQRGDIQRQNNNKRYYALKFTINWKHDGDKIYIAHSYPYTYTRMLKVMKKVSDRQGKNNMQKAIAKKKIQKVNITVQPIKIGKTISCREINAYLISAKKQQKIQPKQAIIFLARQHPGQTQGSFVCQGVIKKLTQSNAQKQVIFLLENYMVYVIPMVNADGVIFGNYRTNLCGKDLNRRWDTQANTSNSLLTPQVVAIKQFLAGLVKNNGLSIRFIIDLHGHSKKLNSFFYGNPCAQNPQLTKMFPYICSRYSEAIQFMDCTFSSQEYKKKAARIYLSSFYQQLHIYTFESSFYGYRNRQGKTVQFTPSQYMKLGGVLVSSLCLLLVKQKKQQSETLSLNNGNSDPKQAVLFKRSIQTYTKFQSQLKQNQLLLQVGDELSSGSESKPQEGQLNNQQIQYHSQEQQPDPRVVVSNKIVSKSQIEKDSIKTNASNISKNKSIRINSRKVSQQGTIQYKQTLNNKHLNKKLITISQVNGVLADKYQISLLPIQRAVYRTGRKCDAQTQTDKQEKLAIRIYKLFQIEQKGNLAGGIGLSEQPNNQASSTAISQKTQSQSLQPKKHSEIVAQIQRNSRHQIYRMNLIGEKQLINKRKITQPSMFKQSISCKQKITRKKDVYTQTLATFKSTKSSLFSDSIQTKSSKIQELKLTQNELRIARMQKINQQVLKIYSKKSAVIDLSFKPKPNRSNEKNQRRNQALNDQTLLK